MKFFKLIFIFIIILINNFVFSSDYKKFINQQNQLLIYKDDVIIYESSNQRWHDDDSSVYELYLEENYFYINRFNYYQDFETQYYVFLDSASKSKLDGCGYSEIEFSFDSRNSTGLICFQDCKGGMLFLYFILSQTNVMKSYLPNSKLLFQQKVFNKGFAWIDRIGFHYYRFEDENILNINDIKYNSFYIINDSIIFLAGEHSLNSYLININNMKYDITSNISFSNNIYANYTYKNYLFLYNETYEYIQSNKIQIISYFYRYDLKDKVLIKVFYLQKDHFNKRYYSIDKDGVLHLYYYVNTPDKQFCHYLTYDIENNKLINDIVVDEFNKFRYK